jgi:hypothetical protein
MKLCIEGDIYFIPKFHILETGTVKLSIETGLIKQVIKKNEKKQKKKIKQINFEIKKNSTVGVRS